MFASGGLPSPALSNAAPTAAACSNRHECNESGERVARLAGLASVAGLAGLASVPELAGLASAFLAAGLAGLAFVAAIDPQLAHVVAQSSENIFATL